MTPRANWKGFLRLSLVTCPVALYPATSESEKVSFNQLNKQTGHRIKYVKVDVDTGEEVPNEDIVKGYALDKETFILARTDAREVLGLDEAFRRAERYLRAGADGIFIESPHSVGELEQIGKKFDVPQLANMLEGGRTPVLKPSELFELGFRMLQVGAGALGFILSRR